MQVAEAPVEGDEDLKKFARFEYPKMRKTQVCLPHQLPPPNTFRAAACMTASGRHLSFQRSSQADLRSTKQIVQHQSHGPLASQAGVLHAATSTSELKRQTFSRTCQQFAWLVVLQQTCSRIGSGKTLLPQPHERSVRIDLLS